jgi:hypothetical protein
MTEATTPHAIGPARRDHFAHCVQVFGGVTPTSRRLGIDERAIRRFVNGEMPVSERLLADTATALQQLIAETAEAEGEIAGLVAGERGNGGPPRLAKHCWRGNNRAMRLRWDEIKRRAKAFSEEWQDAHYEKGETQSFYNDFFDIFGIKRRTVAVYEQRVKLLDNKQGFIDLFWPRTLLVEQKSAGLKLGRAQGQALDYLHGVHATEQPRYILTCNFQQWELLDLETGTELKFRLPDLHKHIAAFDFMLGRKVNFETQANVTIKAAELMGKLHDALEAAGYTGHDLEQFLVRLLFCLFADDTGIFQPKDIFLQLVENDTQPNGSDTGGVLSELFDVLDTPEGQRLTGTTGELDAFPYVNGALFTGRLRIPKFDAKMREHLLEACRHDWSGVSPAIFGSLFQSVMDAKERRAKGAHYTTEANILKVIGPLFLDELKAELAGIKGRSTASGCHGPLSLSGAKAVERKPWRSCRPAHNPSGAGQR